MACRMAWTLLLISVVNVRRGTAISEDQQFWYENGQRTLHEVLERQRQEHVAKNVVLLVGDGMGMSTVTAGRIYRGQEFRQSGEQYRLAFEKFPFVGLAKTYNVNAQVGDSAACATALFCGAKTNFHRVGVDSTSDGNLCTGGRPLSSLIEWAQRAGKATGLVTNTRLTQQRRRR
ncbi:alkaline phosphatase, tissue-nonspecific isozyme-like, partial [Amphibalanus amphitrite]|uniref:alkaline phosphatase, tissue-nonspecific isozyme-like n=1 Tax=Amphibalanus amphitrite TaxID=1232801 RepID=UPI001C91BD1F